MLLLRRVWLRICFFANFPFAMAAYKWREHKLHAQIIPTNWLTSGELIFRDLEYFEPEKEDRFISVETLQDFAQARDNLRESLQKTGAINFTIFLFLLAQYVSIELDISIFWISIKKAPGITEAFLVLLTLSTMYSTLRHRSLYFVESTMHAILHRIVPAELKSLYLSRFFPDEQFGIYYPFNLPHIVAYRSVSTATINSGIFFLGFVVAPAVVAYYCFYFLIIANLWTAPQFGNWSKLLSIYLFAVTAFTLIYALLIRIRMPYRDYQVNQYFELTDQLNPDKKAERLAKIYGELSKNRFDMEAKGYLKPSKMNG